jgi:hypothetical protein
VFHLEGQWILHHLAEKTTAEVVGCTLGTDLTEAGDATDLIAMEAYE